MNIAAFFYNEIVKILQCKTIASGGINPTLIKYSLPN